MRSPEKESATWDVNQMVTTKPLRTDQPIHVMISPEAFLRVMSLVPVGEIGMFGSPEATFMQLHENAQRLAREGVIAFRRRRVLCL